MRIIIAVYFQHAYLVPCTMPFAEAVACHSCLASLDYAFPNHYGISSLRCGPFGKQPEDFTVTS